MVTSCVSCGVVYRMDQMMLYNITARGVSRNISSWKEQLKRAKPFFANYRTVHTHTLTRELIHEWHWHSIQLSRREDSTLDKVKYVSRARHRHRHRAEAISHISFNTVKHNKLMTKQEEHTLHLDDVVVLVYYYHRSFNWWYDMTWHDMTYDWTPHQIRSRRLPTTIADLIYLTYWITAHPHPISICSLSHSRE
jgi:hypothetical protein